jgi:cell wall-associated NlpC family hydrolase
VLAQYPASESDIPNERIFLCHSSADKEAVRSLYGRLKADGLNPWLDEEDLLPGVLWENEIPIAVRDSKYVLVCLSRSSTTKKGFINKEIKFALDVADLQPEGAIYLIPLRLEQCDVPDRLAKWQWVDYFRPNGYERLLRTLKNTGTSIRQNPTYPPKHREPDSAPHIEPPQKGIEQEPPQKVQTRSPSLDRIAAFAFGISFLIAMIVIAVRFPNPPPFQETVFRVILALSAGGVAAFIPGFVRVDIAHKVRAGGAIAVFALVYFLNPAEVVITKTPPVNSNPPGAPTPSTPTIGKAEAMPDSHTGNTSTKTTLQPAAPEHSPRTESTSNVSEPPRNVNGPDKTIAVAPPETSKPETTRAQYDGIAAATLAKNLRAQGVKFKWGGASPQGGFDSSGLVGYILKQQGILPPDWRQMINSQNLPSFLLRRGGRRIGSDDLEDGDLIFVSNFVFVYVGNGSAIGMTGGITGPEDMSEIDVAIKVPEIHQACAGDPDTAASVRCDVIYLRP